jgi:hypothetical protein
MLLREGSDLPVHGSSITFLSPMCVGPPGVVPTNSSRTLVQYQVDREAIPQKVK